MSLIWNTPYLGGRGMVNTRGAPSYTLGELICRVGRPSKLEALPIRYFRVSKCNWPEINPGHPTSATSASPDSTPTGCCVRLQSDFTIATGVI
ncbi:hypothetical protein LX32DRAFT_644862 [Colletotrichum zoysiae]|uniref:Uncharacterized protein n=1 Tax=Colletotrichum zoysiae TaxID=1216348 RepID=A0AAD9H868_9PEZI|nr:hypothetical protein LX32DRAFT_644862 [Colletotrichum zoysiae]